MLERVAKGSFVKLAIWSLMAALALPALPASSCVCSDPGPTCCCASGRDITDTGGVAVHHCCGPRTSSCCGAQASSVKSCCTSSRTCQAATGQCQCGSSCSCKSGFPPVPSRDAPAVPAESPADQLVVMQTNCLDTVAVKDESQLPVTAWQVEAATAFSSLDHCINLSRFTL